MSRLPANELATGLDLIERKRQGRAPPLACCPRCPEPTPLIGTIRFYKAEWYCLECGGRFGFLSPRTVEDTPELKARYEELQREWDDNTAGLLVEGRAPRDDHQADLHAAALAWLHGRMTR